MQKKMPKKDLAIAETATSLEERFNEQLLRTASSTVDALSENVLPGDEASIGDLIRIKVPSGDETQWRWEEMGCAEKATTIQGVVVYYAMQGVLWPTDDPSKSKPLLATNDLVTAYRVGEDTGDIDPAALLAHQKEDGTFDWPALPWTKWGSGKHGVGKRAKEVRLLFLLREGDVLPCLIAAPPGSSQSIRRFMMQLKVPHYQAIISLALETATNDRGNPYPVIKPVLFGTLPEDTGAMLKRTYKEKLKAAADVRKGIYNPVS